jgi:hypothetical protein
MAEVNVQMDTYVSGSYLGTSVLFPNDSDYLGSLVSTSVNNLVNYLSLESILEQPEALQADGVLYNLGSVIPLNLTLTDATSYDLDLQTDLLTPIISSISIPEPTAAGTINTAQHILDYPIILNLELNETQQDDIDLLTELATPIYMEVEMFDAESVNTGANVNFTVPVSMELDLTSIHPSKITHTADRAVAITRLSSVGTSTHLDTNLTSIEQVASFNQLNLSDLIQDLHAVRKDIRRLSSGAVEAWQSAVLDSISDPAISRRIIKTSIYQYAKKAPSSNKEKISV